MRFKIDLPFNKDRMTVSDLKVTAEVLEQIFHLFDRSGMAEVDDGDEDVLSFIMSVSQMRDSFTINGEDE